MYPDFYVTIHYVNIPASSYVLNCSTIVLI